MAGKSTLIFTHSADIHAFAVERVLEIIGGAPSVIITSKLTKDVPLSVKYDQSRTDIRIGEFEGSLEDVRSTWNRRFSKLFMMPADLHPADINFVRNNAQTTLAGVSRLLDDRFPVNPTASARIHSNKLVQLQAARAVGLRTPKTLVSNNYDDIEAFMSSVGEVCMKSFYSHGWKTDAGPRHALNVRLSKDHNYDRRSFEISSNIYQEYVTKKAEYRVVMFADFASCVRIDSHSLNGQSAIDWRSSPEYLSTLMPFELPRSVLGALRQVLAKLGLRFGAFDLAETTDGEFVFFEVNEQGQWLWQDLHCPGCRILQPFSEYLFQADDGFRWDSRRFSDELSAENICREMGVDPRFREEEIEGFPDEAVHVSDEREAAVSG
jgi:glutathione synthase/RimK-type ligase-like ATP-grasp enzyme